MNANFAMGARLATLHFFRCLAVLCFAVLAGCASTAVRDADQLGLAGRHEQAIALLDQALAQQPGDRTLEAARARQREAAVAALVRQAEGWRAVGQTEPARDALKRLLVIDARHPRVLALQHEIERDDHHAELIAQASDALAKDQTAVARAKLREVLVEAPGLPAARELQRKLAQRQAPPPLPSTMAAAFQKPIALEFREAPLRSVFEAMSRTSGINFVFDKDVRVDTKVTAMLRDVTVDEAMRVILSTQQLDRKLLNDRSVLIFPNNQAKQREHQELVTRSFYLANADVRQAQSLVRTVAKTRDLFVDERLNLLVVRDTPEVVHLVEGLIASLDLPDPEVMLDVEVMEIASNRLDELGLRWPDQVTYGLPDVPAGGTVLLSQRGEFRATITNPAVVATLHGSYGSSKLIANPKLRARNHEKAKVQIGERLPVFTTTSTANVGVSTSVNYVDVGLKLDVEPSVQLDNEVIMKVGLEVSSLVRQVSNGRGDMAYQVGTRLATTSLRLRDGETQILAGLINDEERKNAEGLPWLSDLPLVGRLFGVDSDTHNKTEIVLLITPHVVRNLGLPDADVLEMPAGTDALPGADTVRMGSHGKALVAQAGAGGSGVGGGSGGSAKPVADAPPTDTPPPVAVNAVLELATSGEIGPGSTASVTLRNSSPGAMRGELEFDTRLFQLAQGGGEAGSPRVPFELSPGGQQVIVLRALPAAAGQRSQVNVVTIATTGPGGEALDTQVHGDGAIVVKAK